MHQGRCNYRELAPPGRDSGRGFFPFIALPEPPGHQCLFFEAVSTPRF